MSMVFGGQTILFRTRIEGKRDAAGVPKYSTKDSNPVPGCRHRPLTAVEKHDVLGAGSQYLTTEVWKTTAPPVEEVLSARSTSIMLVDGDEEEVIANPQVFPDMHGDPYKVTLLSKRVTL